MKQNGFTIIELMVTVVIAGVLLSLGISSFQTMLATSQSKAVAESIMSGLRLARAEAIKRNVPMRLQLVTTLDDSCVYDDTASLWVVTQADSALHGLAQNHCASMPYTPPDQPDICNPDVPLCTAVLTTGCRGLPATTNPNPIACSDDPLIAYKSDKVSYPTVVVAGSSTLGGAASVVTFSPIGRMLSNSVGGNSLDRITISSTNSDAKTWRIQIAAGSGSLRLCDPNAGSTAALACP